MTRRELLSATIPLAFRLRQGFGETAVASAEAVRPRLSFLRSLLRGEATSAPRRLGLGAGDLTPLGGILFSLVASTFRWKERQAVGRGLHPASFRRPRARRGHVNSPAPRPTRGKPRLRRVPHDDRVGSGLSNVMPESFARPGLSTVIVETGPPRIGTAAAWFSDRGIALAASRRGADVTSPRVCFPVGTYQTGECTA